MNDTAPQTDSLDAVPQLLLDLGSAEDPRRRGVAGVASLTLHGLLILVLNVAFSSSETVGPAAHDISRLRDATPLVAPLTTLTQKEPNRGPLSKEVNVESLRARLRAPALPSPPPRRFEPPQISAPGSPAPPALPEPPKIETPPSGATQVAQGLPVPLPPPPGPPVEKPKLAFEKPGAQTGVPQGGGRLAPPSASLEDIRRGMARGGTGGRIVIGDADSGAELPGSAGSPPSAPRSGSSLELLSDPMGVDFRPYLLRILTTVRRNWLAVIPESVKLGRRGQVVIQFAISKDGRVPKLVIAMSSGADALDRAAVAGISASNPFPPLPAEFKGDQIRVQFTFSYNMR